MGLFFGFSGNSYPSSEWGVIFVIQISIENILKVGLVIDS